MPLLLATSGKGNISSNSQEELIMKSLKTLAMVMVLGLALAMGAGCAKKNVEEVAPAPAAKAVSTKAISKGLTKNVVYFEYNKYDIKAEYRDMLQKVADTLKTYPSIVVLIAGNCDERGTAEYNYALGERRARAVYEYLVRLGVPAEQLDVISFGEDRPAAKGTGEEAWAKNRRGEFTIMAY